jgi:hypothetical protein
VEIKAFNLKTKITTICFVTIITLANLSQVKATLCSKEVPKTECSKGLANYPLFDTPYKLHANYLPILALRALAHGDIYKEKKKFSLERYYFVKNTSGAFQEHYAKLIGSGEVSGHGFIGRKISFQGKLNEFPFEYENKMTFSLPKRARMNIKAELDGIRFLELEIHSDGDKMTNDVEGTFFTKKVKYHTEHRDSEGILADLPYKLHTEGKVKEADNFHTVTEGSIGEYKISGSGNLTAYNKYLTIEHYGPIMVKTYITVID